MEKHTVTKTRLRFFVISIILCAILFPLDLVVPLGYVEWLFYLIPLTIVYWANNTILTFVILLIIGVLLSLGYYFSPTDKVQSVISITNRIEGFAGFLIFSLIVNSLIKSRNALLAANNIVNKWAAELAQANKELETFSYSASHDLRSPLNVIISFCKILSEDYNAVLDETGRDHIERISNVANKMLNIIEDLLSLSRINRQEMRIEEIDISQIARSILTDLASTHPERSVSWEVQDGLMITADKGLIEIALSNILRNSWKYTGKTNTPEIRVGSVAKADQTVFYVRDNGAGFDMQHADKLFTAFQRLHPGNEFSGTGIGLAIVERIINRHHGKIWAESQVGKGATFYFAFGQPDDR